MGTSLFEGAMGHSPASEQRWHHGEGKDSRQRPWIPDRVGNDGRERRLRERQGTDGGIKSWRLPRIDHLHVQAVKVPDVAGCDGQVMGFRRSCDQRIAQVQPTAAMVRVCPKPGCPLCPNPLRRERENSAMRWRSYEGKDAGSPIGSGMTEKGKRRLPLLAPPALSLCYSRLVP